MLGIRVHKKRGDMQTAAKIQVRLRFMFIPVFGIHIRFSPLFPSLPQQWDRGIQSGAIEGEVCKLTGGQKSSIF